MPFTHCVKNRTMVETQHSNQKCPVCHRFVMILQKISTLHRSVVLNRWFATHFSFCADFLAPRKISLNFSTKKLFFVRKSCSNFFVKSTPDLEQRCLTRNIPVAIFAIFVATVSQLRKYAAKTAFYKNFPLQI